MADKEDRLNTLFLNKPEHVIDCVARISPEILRAYRAAEGLALVEIAGRDSIAAAVRAVQEEALSDLIPTYVYTGTEHGPWSTVQEAVRRLADRLPGIRVHDLLVLGSPGFWQALNGRLMSDLIAAFGFFTPCVGCHLYLHSVRIPLALSLGGIPIISGERESHDAHLKVNQTPQALDLYAGLAREFGVRLLMPVRRVARGMEIRDLVGMAWEQGEEQLGCVLSGNYRRRSGDTGVTPRQVQRFLQAFALPCSRRIVASYVAGDTPDHLEIASQVLPPSCATTTPADHRVS